MNCLAKEVKLISAKGLTKDLIKEHNILNGERYFSLHGSQNYLVFQLHYRYFILRY